ncbi:uncharacterized protein LOC110831176 isoform X2 [Zootermopsis nevadensis]|nr:uncharacterized protein LOC110831176 isoform X2 [Zootermopsis nevadensis]
MCLTFVKMAQTRHENELGTASDKCQRTIGDEDNGSSYLPTSKNTTTSTGRKSFSRRRSSCFDTQEISGSTSNKNTNHQLGVEESGTAATSTKECMQKLKLEKEAWRTMCEERKKAYETMKENLNSKPLKLDWDNCADALSDEDKQFLNDHPQYENIVAKMNQVAEVASICTHMRYKSAHTSAKIIATAEQQGVALKKKIVKYVESYYI